MPSVGMPSMPSVSMPQMNIPKIGMPSFGSGKREGVSTNVEVPEVDVEVAKKEGWKMPSVGMPSMPNLSMPSMPSMNLGFGSSGSSTEDVEKKEGWKMPSVGMTSMPSVSMPNLSFGSSKREGVSAEVEVPEVDVEVAKKEGWKMPSVSMPSMPNVSLPSVNFGFGSGGKKEASSADRELPTSAEGVTETSTASASWSLPAMPDLSVSSSEKDKVVEDSFSDAGSTSTGPISVMSSPGKRKSPKKRISFQMPSEDDYIPAPIFEEEVKVAPKRSSSILSYTPAEMTWIIEGGAGAPAADGEATDGKITVVQTNSEEEKADGSDEKLKGSGDATSPRRATSNFSVVRNYLLGGRKRSMEPVSSKESGASSASTDAEATPYEITESTRQISSKQGDDAETFHDAAEDLSSTDAANAETASREVESAGEIASTTFKPALARSFSMLPSTSATTEADNEHAARGGSMERRASEPALDSAVAAAVATSTETVSDSNEGASQDRELSISKMEDTEAEARAPMLPAAPPRDSINTPPPLNTPIPLEVAPTTPRDFHVMHYTLDPVTNILRGAFQVYNYCYHKKVYAQIWDEEGSEVGRVYSNYSRLIEGSGVDEIWEFEGECPVEGVEFTAKFEALEIGLLYIDDNNGKFFPLRSNEPPKQEANIPAIEELEAVENLPDADSENMSREMPSIADISTISDVSTVDEDAPIVDDVPVVEEVQVPAETSRELPATEEVAVVAPATEVVEVQPVASETASRELPAAAVAETTETKETVVNYVTIETTVENTVNSKLTIFISTLRSLRSRLISLWRKRVDAYVATKHSYCYGDGMIPFSGNAFLDRVEEVLEGGLKEVRKMWNEDGIEEMVGEKGAWINGFLADPMFTEHPRFMPLARLMVLVDEKIDHMARAAEIVAGVSDVGQQLR
ncbi:hypothetical protein HDU97_002602 [Phlyctochytrium planicorne]|nr:hypothetical protein HDU97_002602 [Phlyctochytrium planicorne]